LKDHVTGITYIKPIPRNKAKYLACELDHIFGLIGYSTSFHTDNGKAFVAKAVIQIIKKNNPKMHTTWSCAPCDQDSVESMNKLSKSVLKCIELKVENLGKDPIWTSLLGRVTSAVRSRLEEK